MDDKLFITKFLDESYSIKAGPNDFYIFDKKDNSPFNEINLDKFRIVFYKIIGDYETNDGENTIEVFYRWYEDKKRIITKELYDWFDTIDGKKGADRHLEDTLEHFSDDELSDSFITNKFEPYYWRSFIKEKFDYFLETIDINKGSRHCYNVLQKIFYLDIKLYKQKLTSKFNDYYGTKFKVLVDKYLENVDKEITSVQLINRFPIPLDYEMDIFSEYAIKYINDWYAIRYLSDKVDLFLRELVVTLGKTNWQVTWIGHGPITKDKLLSQFMDENVYHEKYILQKYEEWYEQEVIGASERALKLY